jgi:hypothetical protein
MAKSISFHDITIDATGGLRCRRVHDSATLLPATVAIFRDLIERQGEEFRVPLPVEVPDHVELALTRAGSAALATFWARGAPVTTSALVPGIDPTDDRRALEGLQSLILCLCGDCPGEPGFDLLTIPDRPLLATVPIPPPGPDLGTIADAETCLAAAFFLHVMGAD